MKETDRKKSIPEGGGASLSVVLTPLHWSLSLLSIGTVQFSGSGLLTPVTSSGVRTCVSGTTDD